ncbi:MAG: hypothetical protein JWQ72_3882 [Polaromonas sp.]|nr:hypothetical protein [Polaromonas sp.]
MTRQLQPDRLNMRAFAREADALEGAAPLQKMARLASETRDLAPDAAAQWKAQGELREHSGAEPDVWLHLTAQASVALTCQRCLGPVVTPLQVDQWYRFVATEEIAMAEDDQSEEDLLVMEPQFDLLSLLEDELLLALPLVPMHEQCPDSPVAASREDDPPAEDPPARPNPFAVLAQLRKKDGA